MDKEQLLQRIIVWAETSPDIRAAVLIGSQTRTDHPADEWSDLDITIITTRPKQYLSTSDWVASIGPTWLTFLEGTATGGEIERRVLFKNGLDVDFSVFPMRKVQQLGYALRIKKYAPLLYYLLSHTLARQVHSRLEEIASVFQRGLRILVDKDAITTSWAYLPQKSPRDQLPTQHQFLEVVNDFLYHGIWAAKKLRRGEMFVAKGTTDSYMKYLLLTMVEWHALTHHGTNYDTWHNGRFLEQWADPRIIEGLYTAYAHYDKDEVEHAIQATIRLFSWVAQETAQQLGYAYPITAEQHIIEWLQKH